MRVRSVPPPNQRSITSSLVIVQFKHAVIAMHCRYKWIIRVNHRAQTTGKPFVAIQF